MATRAVGLDIGTHAVRAAELALGRNDEATLVRFGQVTLEPGAVRDGEVVDPPAVSAAIRRLWTEARFTAKSVVVGVGNQRVVVRQAELPAMTEEDLRSAIQFEAADLIPIPIDEALLDFQILDHFTNDAGEARMNILLVAAQRDMVRSLLAAVEGAGLAASIVDVVPFALIRSVGSPPDVLERRAEAIVAIGAGVTNVVVHEDGVPRFVRMLVVGGQGTTDAIAEELGVDQETAEDLKRRAQAGSPDQLEAAAARIADDRLLPLVEEIRGSLDFYQAQAGASPIARLLVTGGGSRQRGLLERLRDHTGLPVEPAHPLVGLEVGRIGIPEEQLVDAEPLLAVPVGLALAGRAPATGRRLTLLPRELLVVREQRRQSLLVAGGVGALAALLLGVWALGNSSVSSERRKADDAEAEVSRLRQQLAGVQDAGQLQQQVDDRRKLVTAALSNDVAWTRLLQQIATVIPNDVWLTQFSGSADGAVNVSAMGFDHTSAARWLLRVGELPSIQNLWLPSSTKQGEGANSLVQFQSTATLTPAAQSNRAARYAGATP